MIVEKTGVPSDRKVSKDLVSQIIMENETEDYSSILQNGYDWNTFYHLSNMRQSLLNWYDFHKGGYALELQGEYGALTGVLCDRCKEVVSLVSTREEAEILQKRYAKRKNLTIYVGTIEDFVFQKKFDYIVDICGLEKIKTEEKNNDAYVRYINLLAGYLSEKGKLLTVMENRYGVKYFCGAKEKYSQLPFFGINQFFQEEHGHLFHKKEIENILEQSLLKNYKFYYPLPDYILPQVIFTDEYYSGILVSERLNPYNIEKTTLVATERTLYKDIIDNGALSFLSNSFFVECGRSDNLSDIVSAVMSTDRDKKESYATCIHSNHTVTKRNLFPEGKESIKTLCKNIEELSQRGIKTLSHKICDEQIMMPYVKEKRLSDIFSEIYDKDAANYIKLWDDLYQLILRSSDAVKKDEDWILKKAYLDLVPGNIFMIDNEFYVYDQEFVKENCSAKYVLFRGIKYTYMALDESKFLVPIAELKERYGLLKQWNEFEQMEQAFIANNRQTQIYKQFYEWADCNRWIIAKRGERVGEIIV